MKRSEAEFRDGGTERCEDGKMETGKGETGKGEMGEREKGDGNQDIKKPGYENRAYLFGNRFRM